jgi:hypothetical protein
MDYKDQIDALPPQRKAVNWREILEALDRAGVPNDFLSDRDESFPQLRPTLSF